MTDRMSNRRPETGAFFRRDLGQHPPAYTPIYKTSVLRSPQRALLSLDGTLSEITGPVFGHNILGELDNDLIHNFAKPGESAIGPRIIVYGRVLDERGKGVSGALLEFWQANAGGRYRHKKEGYIAPLDPNFGGCGRTITAEDGSYSFRTIQPGPYPWPNGPNDWRPAHIHFSIFGHGFAQRLITQMYFEGDPMIWQCPIVRTIPDRAAIERLVAALDMEGTIPMDARAYKFDIVLRGRRSSPFENRLEGN
jgi:protocatechuate 3,4-dioxygenase beta subunit